MITRDELYELAELGFNLMEAQHDINEYMAPDDSDGWYKPDRLLMEVDESERIFKNAIEKLIQSHKSH